MLCKHAMTFHWLADHWNGRAQPHCKVHGDAHQQEDELVVDDKSSMVVKPMWGPFSFSLLVVKVLGTSFGRTL